MIYFGASAIISTRHLPVRTLRNMPRSDHRAHLASLPFLLGPIACHVMAESPGSSSAARCPVPMPSCPPPPAAASLLSDNYETPRARWRWRWYPLTRFRPFGGGTLSAHAPSTPGSAYCIMPLPNTVSITPSVPAVALTNSSTFFQVLARIVVPLASLPSNLGRGPPLGHDVQALFPILLFKVPSVIVVASRVPLVLVFRLVPRAHPTSYGAAPRGGRPTRPLVVDDAPQDRRGRAR